MFMRMTVADSIKTTLPKTESAKEFMGFVGEHSQTTNKSLVGTLMSTLTTIKFDGSRTMHEHVIVMTHITTRLKYLEMAVNENFLVQFILNSLPTEYGPFLPHNTWWINSGCTNHVSNTMQGFTIIQIISPNEKFFFMGNRVKVLVEAVGTYRLILNTGHHLDLLETLYVPSLSRNLVSLSKLDAIGYSFTFGNGCFSLFKHNHLIGTVTICDDLYKLNLDGLYDETLLTLHHNISTKRSLVNEHSAFLWHKRLGHICRERMEKLIKKGYFIGYPEKSKGYMFYCPKHSMRFFETGNARFIENGEVSGSTIPQKVEVNEVRMQVPLTYASRNKVSVPLTIVSNNNEEEQHNNEPMIHNELIVEHPHEITLRRSQREKRPAISNDYMVYLHELEIDSSINENDPVSFSQAVSCDNFEKWLNSMKEELKSTEQNDVWDLVELPEDCKRVGCKWVFKTITLRSQGLLGLSQKAYINKVLESKNDKYSKGAKHIELEYLVVKEKVQRQRVSIEHISTNLTIADPLTKGLPPKTFIEHVKNMGIIVINGC
uniref:Retrovirus-related Pol polyprotein from transposon TNT 1-94 n=1 Tax=Cajanus cajan TaxID=3821 RepID=A0A151QY79_CAJCA|nr:Retrovirus-related Pol polyprotein from transposon TNT 1-94 [Cajanus cajan]